MIPEDKLSDVLARNDFDQADKIYSCLFSDGNKPKQVREIKTIGKKFGIHRIDKWNVSSQLAKKKNYAVKTPSGWKLTQDGIDYIQSKIGQIVSPRITKATVSIYTALKGVSKQETKNFILEAVGCFERKFYRASIVLSWSGAISILYEYVVKNNLVKFNAEAKRRNSKWKDAKNTDDLGRMKEFDFLNVIESISIIGKNLKQELEICLKLRNACGHPNSLIIAEARVLAHLEILTLNVYTKF